MSPAQEQGWRVLLGLGAVLPDGWCIVGGQLVWLLAAEHGVEPVRATDDVDLVVDVRTHPGGVRRVCQWLEGEGFALEGINTHGLGHRYVRETSGTPGKVLFDVLAPDHLGQRVDLTTTPPARTLQVPGARAALQDAEPVNVDVAGVTGVVRRPPLVAAIATKIAAAGVAVRDNPDRDWSDIAFLLSLVPDPIAAAEGLTQAGRKRLRDAAPLLDEGHWAWRLLAPERARAGQAALTLMQSRAGGRRG